MTAPVARRVAIPIIPEMPHAVSSAERIRELAGTTMGTTWTVKFVGSSARAQTLHRMIPLALERVIAQMSPWEGQSDISRFNRLALNRWQDLPPEFSRV